MTLTAGTSLMGFNEEQKRMCEHFLQNNLADSEATTKVPSKHINIPKSHLCGWLKLKRLGRFLWADSPGGCFDCGGFWVLSNMASRSWLFGPGTLDSGSLTLVWHHIWGLKKRFIPGQDLLFNVHQSSVLKFKGTERSGSVNISIWRRTVFLANGFCSVIISAAVSFAKLYRLILHP